MGEHNFIPDTTVSVVVVFFIVAALHLAHTPRISGLVLAGAVLSLIGPEVLHWISFERETVAEGSEWAVSVMMFTLGLATPIAVLAKRWQLITVGGGLQLALTIIFGGCAAYFIVPHCNFSQALFFGMLISTSSTAHVFQQLREKKEAHSRAGIVAESMLLSHDLVLIVYALLIPKLAVDPALRPEGSLFVQMIIGITIVAGVFALEWLVISRVLNFIGKYFDSNLFNLAVLAIVLVTIWAATTAGLAIPFGAFLAGLLIAKTRYRHQLSGLSTMARDNALPVFFLFIGLLVKWDVLAEHWLRILLSAVGLIVIKFAAASFSAWVIGLPLRSAVRTGLYLAHIGELAVVLAAAGAHLGLISDTDRDVVLMLVVVSLGFSPLLSGAWMNRLLQRIPEITMLHSLRNDPIWDLAPRELGKHFIIIGFGRIGKAIAAELKARSVPFLVIDQSTVLYDEAKALGYDPIYGDATHHKVLDAAGIRRCSVIVITDGDAAMVAAIKLHLADDPAPHLIVRVNSVAEGEEVRAAHSEAKVVTAEGAVQSGLLEMIFSLLPQEEESKASPPAAPREAVASAETSTSA